jgi:hypothetical protein
MPVRSVALIVLVMLGCHHQRLDRVMSVCDLSRDYGAYRDRPVAVRGVYFYGLRQQCPETCATGPWPSFVDLVGSKAADANWVALDQAERSAEREAKRGRRVEVWVTVRGRLRASDHSSPVDACDPVVNSGYGHLGSYPAQIEVEAFDDIQVVANGDSPWDYGHIYRGAM